ncbi:GNAT family N-acetyltransferase [Cognataquiflexum rubidum]|uniref:GNAT family N-acetyltransferase n=1 Tax=Cognataquiflexum rubidum TaxID=2922273 RepID=UPI001F12B152|nr:GNAT family N-acetyltransferase [Cognataquiflexum rubidum]MCH6236500.1 GNAT family N-acetyltransferase [Cognataquiflexum rubidum]
MRINDLQWDSQLFGYSVGKIEIDNSEFDPLRFLEFSANYKLVYLFSSKPIDTLPENTILVDTKVTLVKELGGIQDWDDVEFFEGKLSESLISLGFQSGELSRFKIDKRLSKNEFEKLYIKWLERDLNSGKIIIQKIERKMAGLITLRFSGDQSSIGLFAVDNAYRGKGIGYKLLQAAQYISVKNGIKKISVQTQFQNKRAISLYEKFGFVQQNKKYIYHYVNPKNT